MEGTLDLPADPIYVIFKHLPWTKCHCTITETVPPVCNILALALETVHSHTPQNKHQKYQVRSIHKPGIVFPAYSLLLINYFLNFFHKCIYIFKLPVYRCKTYIRNCIKVFKFIHYKFTYIAACYFLLLF